MPKRCQLTLQKATYVLHCQFMCDFSAHSDSPIRPTSITLLHAEQLDFSRTSVTIQGLFKALCKFKDFSRQAVKFKGFSRLYEPCATGPVPWSQRFSRAPGRRRRTSGELRLRLTARSHLRRPRQRENLWDQGRGLDYQVIISSTIIQVRRRLYLTFLTD